MNAAIWMDYERGDSRIRLTWWIEREEIRWGYRVLSGVFRTMPMLVPPSNQMIAEKFDMALEYSMALSISEPLAECIATLAMERATTGSTYAVPTDLREIRTTMTRAARLASEITHIDQITYLPGSIRHHHISQDMMASSDATYAGSEVSSPEPVRRWKWYAHMQSTTS